MNALFSRLEEIKLLPVVRIDNAKDAVPLAKALQDGGLCGAEITFRTDAAADAIRNIKNAFPDFLLGAGTVLSPAQADKALAAGASFAVSPGFNPKVVAHCLDKGLPIIPGVCTPTEVEAALEWGLDHLKFFPAEAAGGIPMLKSLAGPYGFVRFMPTGGISAQNIAAYLTCRNVFACGGSWMVPADMIAAGNFDAITRLTAEAVQYI